MAPLSTGLQARNTLNSAVRFLMVGFLGTLIDFGLFAILKVHFGLPTLPANSLSYSMGIINNYILHRKWTFAHRAQKEAARQFTQFVGISLSAMVLNNLVVMLLSPAFEGLFLEPGQTTVLAKSCALGVGVLWNYFANSLWTFRQAS